MVDEMIQNQPDWRKMPHPYATAKTASHWNGFVTILGKVHSNSHNQIIIDDSTDKLKINFSEFDEHFDEGQFVQVIGEVEGGEIAAKEVVKIKGSEDSLKLRAKISELLTHHGHLFYAQ